MHTINAPLLMCHGQQYPFFDSLPFGASCVHSACSRRTFSEPLPDVVAPSARSSLRLAAEQQRLGLQVGGARAARIAQRQGMSISPAPVLRLVRRTPVAEHATRAARARATSASTTTRSEPTGKERARPTTTGATANATGCVVAAPSARCTLWGATSGAQAHGGS